MAPTFSLTRPYRTSLTARAGSGGCPRAPGPPPPRHHIAATDAGSAASWGVSRTTGTANWWIVAAVSAVIAGAVAVEWVARDPKLVDAVIMQVGRSRAAVFIGATREFRPSRRGYAPPHA